MEEEYIKMLVGKPAVKSRFERSRRRWENNIRMNVTKNGKDGIAGFICHGQGRNLGSCKKKGNKFCVS
jgi:hypothetical protein